MHSSDTQRFKNPAQLLQYMGNITYKDFDVLMSPNEVFVTCEGSCHDQVMLELDELTVQGLNPTAKFLMAVDNDSVGGETHSFVYWERDNIYYWFKNAWSDYIGIHRFDSEQELLDFVISAFKSRNPHQYIYISDFDPDSHFIGEDLQTLVDVCMDNAVLV
jgi:hypothetical protein